MKEKIISFIYGAVLLNVSGDNIERFINLCRSNDIYIWNVIRDKNCRMWLGIDDYFRLKNIVKKTKSKVHILKRYGLPFFINRYRKRKMFFAGIVISFILIYILSLYIWDIQVQGNYSHSDFEIEKFLKEADIVPGIVKKKISCDEIEKEIRNHYFDITWVSVEVKGTRLTVHIKENEQELGLADSKEDVKENNQYKDIVATKDAIIESVVMRSGTPLVKEGVEVKAGDVLVYGHYDVVDDSATTVRTQYLTADADVYGIVVYNYEHQFPLAYMKKEYEEKNEQYFSLRIGEKIYGFKEKKTEDKRDCFSEEMQVSLYGDFYIPVYMNKRTYQYYTEKEYVYTKEQAEDISREKLQYFIKKLQKSTIQILENNVTIEVNENTCYSKGTISVIENIGRLQDAVIMPEEITQEQN